MKGVSFLIFILFHLNSASQINSYCNLVDVALKNRSGLFVAVKPITDMHLDKNEIRMYAENLANWSNEILDTSMFLEIIQNAGIIDTACWTDEEVPFALLVNNRNEFISKKYASKKLCQGKKLSKSYNKQINQFNETDPYDRDIRYCSRPVFDNTKQFAIVQWNNPHSGLGGGGNIMVYRLQGDKWKEIGIIENWRY